MKKRVLTVITLCCIFMIVGASASFAGSNPTAARTAAVIEPGVSIENAAGVAFDQEYSCSMSPKVNNKHYFAFEIPSSGEVSIQLSSTLRTTALYIYDQKPKEIWEREYLSQDTSVGSYNGTVKVHLTKGKYYLRIQGSDTEVDSTYSFKLGFASAEESFTETTGGTNNTLDTASEINMGTNYKGQIAPNDEKDFYKFSVPTSGKINVNLTSYIVNSTTWRLYNTNGIEIYASNGHTRNTTTGSYHGNEDVYLTKGTYYLLVRGEYHFDLQDSDTGNYNFALTYTSSGESFAETGNGTNNSMETASLISLGKAYKGQLAANDNKDFYRFSSTSGKIALNVTSGIYEMDWYLYDQNANVIDRGSFYNRNSPQKLGFQKLLTLPSSGIYYFCLEKAYESYFGDYSFSVSKYNTKITAKSYTKTYGAPSFYIEAAASDDETLTFSSSNSKVASVDMYSGWTTVGNPGKATITISAQGTNASKQITITVKPKKAALTKVKPGKKSLKATWKRDATVTGYEVVIAQNSKFTKGKKAATVSKNNSTAKTFKKLKSKKTYYVKVRAYKISGKTKIYGSYSKVKKTKVK